MGMMGQFKEESAADMYLDAKKRVLSSRWKGQLSPPS